MCLHVNVPNRYLCFFYSTIPAEEKKHGPCFPSGGLSISQRPPAVHTQKMYVGAVMVSGACQQGGCFSSSLLCPAVGPLRWTSSGCIRGGVCQVWGHQSGLWRGAVKIKHLINQLCGVSLLAVCWQLSSLDCDINLIFCLLFKVLCRLGFKMLATSNQVRGYVWSQRNRGRNKIGRARICSILAF